MNSIRRYLRRGSIVKLLFLTVFLRSLIAPGLTIDTSPESPLGVTLAFCGVLSNSSIDENNSDSSHGHDHSHHHPATTDKDRDIEHGLSESHCGVLLVGVTFVAAKHADFSGLYLLGGDSQYLPEYHSLNNQSTIFHRPQSRAPPASHII